MYKDLVVIILMERKKIAALYGVFTVDPQTQ